MLPLQGIARRKATGGDVVGLSKAFKITWLLGQADNDRLVAHARVCEDKPSKRDGSNVTRSSRVVDRWYVLRVRFTSQRDGDEVQPTPCVGRCCPAMQTLKNVDIHKYLEDRMDSLWPRPSPPLPMSKTTIIPEWSTSRAILRVHRVTKGAQLRATRRAYPMREVRVV